MDSVDWSFYPATDSPEQWRRWDAFNAQTLDTPLLNSSFLTAALAHFGHGKEVLALGHDAEGLAAACLLNLAPVFLPHTFAPSQLPVCPWLQRKDIAFGRAASSLVARLSPTTLIGSFTSLDPRLVPPPRPQRRLETISHISTGAIALPGTFSDYLLGRTRKAVANTRRRVRKAEMEVGEPRLEILTSPDDVPGALNAYADMESESWKAGEGTALVRGGAQTEFYTQVMKDFCAMGKGRIYQLRFGSRIVAMELAVIAGQIAYMLKTTYDINFRACGPGVLLKWFLIQSLYDEKPIVRRLEHYGPLNESQLPWITEARDLYHVNVYRYPLLSRLHRMSKKVRM